MKLSALLGLALLVIMSLHLLAADVVEQWFGKNEITADEPNALVE